MALGTAVLVHGGWSNPSDWRWVADGLRDHNIIVSAPDLPSHHGTGADRTADVSAVETVVAGAVTPIVLVGWSYAGSVLNDLDPTLPITRLIYVASIPQPIRVSDGDEAPALEVDLSHILFPDERTCLLDDEWWLYESDEATRFPGAVLSHFRSHRRRPFTISALLSPPVREAWRILPTTILLGRSDLMLPLVSQEWASRHFDDVRVVDGDHFLPVLRPDVIVDVVVEALGGATEAPSS